MGSFKGLPPGADDPGISGGARVETAAAAAPGIAKGGTACEDLADALARSTWFPFAGSSGATVDTQSADTVKVDTHIKEY